MTSFSAVFLDVDDVMLDMDRVAHLGVEAVLAPLTAALGETEARAVQASFADGYATLIAELRSGGGEAGSAYTTLRRKIARWQRGATEQGYELKMFSRHTLLAIALEAHGQPVTEALIDGAIDHYWQVLADATEVFADARIAVERLVESGTPFLLATNSDGFLLFDERAQTFRYDPEDAVRRKRARLSALRAIGIDDAQISIGDPIGKPNPGFYQAVLADFERFFGRPPDLSRALAVGDSLTSDVLPLMSLGVRWGGWVQRRRTDAPVFDPDHPRVASVRDLTELWSVEWPGG